jgi:hypothetical protein
VSVPQGCAADEVACALPGNSCRMEETLIDRVYGCSFIPELWPGVLRDTSKLSESVGASLFVTNPDVPAWTASKNAKGITGHFINDGWYWRGKLMSMVHKSRHAGFLRDVDVSTPGELEDEPIYPDNFNQLGFGWSAVGGHVTGRGAPRV